MGTGTWIVCWDSLVITETHFLRYIHDFGTMDLQYGLQHILSLYSTSCDATVVKNNINPMDNISCPLSCIHRIPK